MKVRPIHFVPDVDEALRLYAALGLVPHARSRVGNWVELEASGGELGVHDGRSADDGSGAKGSFSALKRGVSSMKTLDSIFRAPHHRPRLTR